MFVIRSTIHFIRYNIPNGIKFGLYNMKSNCTYQILFVFSNVMDKTTAKGTKIASGVVMKGTIAKMPENLFLLKVQGK